MSAHNLTKPSFYQRWDEYHPSKTMLFWACVAAGITTMVIGFGWGGWVTGSTSQRMATTAGETARGELATAICVERFNAAGDAATKIAEFQAIPDSYKQRQFIETGGWATMPGQTSSDKLGVQGCATALAA